MNELYSGNTVGARMGHLPCQLNDFRKPKGEKLVLLLKSLLKDCGYSNPNLYTISLTVNALVDSLSFVFYKFIMDDLMGVLFRERFKKAS